LSFAPEGSATLSALLLTEEVARAFGGLGIIVFNWRGDKTVDLRVILIHEI